MNNLTSKKWWSAAFTRALKTFGQTGSAMIPTAIMITDVDWMIVLGTSATSFVLSILTSLAGLPEVDDE